VPSRQFAGPARHPLNIHSPSVAPINKRNKCDACLVLFLRDSENRANRKKEQQEKKKKARTFSSPLFFLSPPSHLCSLTCIQHTLVHYQLQQHFDFLTLSQVQKSLFSPYLLKLSSTRYETSPAFSLLLCHRHACITSSCSSRTNSSRNSHHQPVAEQISR
jgi:hypothetical protein